MDDSHVETARVRRIYDQLAPRYDSAIVVAERLLFGDGRRRVCEQARGDVLELAIGTARNLPYYSREMRLVGVELSAAMLRQARQRAELLDRPLALSIADAEALPFPAATFDTVVATLALCSIPDHDRALAEARRVLRPGGRLLLLEHVRSPLLPIRLAQRLLDPLTVRLQADHLLREPLDSLGRYGFVVERLERSALGIVERLTAGVPLTAARPQTSSA